LIVPVVEGHSEVLSIGVLTRRVLHELDVFDVEIAQPFRVKRNHVVRRDVLERTVIQAVRTRPGATGILVILDADADCPASLSRELKTRASAITELLVCVVLPKIEIEAWILAGIESLRGYRGILADACAPSDPEAVRDAKGAISKLMTGSRGYVPTDDMCALFAVIDLEQVASGAPSFSKFRRDVAALGGG
jgi:uncharacterized protein DUF4276